MGTGKFIFEVGKKLVSGGRKNPTRRKPKAQIKKGDKSIVFDIAKGSKAKSSGFARKDISDEAGDITQPADTSSLTKELKANDPGKRTTLQVEGGRRKGVQSAVNTSRRERKSLEARLNKLQTSNADLAEKTKKLEQQKVPLTSKAKSGKSRPKAQQKFLNARKNDLRLKVDTSKRQLEENTSLIRSVKEQINLINTRIRDMKSKNPVKKAGGKIVARKKSGKVGTKKAGCKAGQGKAMRGF